MKMSSLHLFLAISLPLMSLLQASSIAPSEPPMVTLPLAEGDGDQCKPITDHDLAVLAVQLGHRAVAIHNGEQEAKGDHRKPLELLKMMNAEICTQIKALKFRLTILARRLSTSYDCTYQVVILEPIHVVGGVAPTSSEVLLEFKPLRGVEC